MTSPEHFEIPKLMSEEFEDEGSGLLIRFTLEDFDFGERSSDSVSTTTTSKFFLGKPLAILPKFCSQFELSW